MWFCQQPKNAKNREINKTYPENNIPSVFKHLTYIGSITQDRKSPKAMYHLRFSTLDSANSFQRCWCRFKTRNGQSHMYGPGVQLVAWRRIKREQERRKGNVKYSNQTALPLSRHVQPPGLTSTILLWTLTEHLICSPDNTLHSSLLLFSMYFLLLKSVWTFCPYPLLSNHDIYICVVYMQTETRWLREDKNWSYWLKMSDRIIHRIHLLTLTHSHWVETL